MKSFKVVFAAAVVAAVGFARADATTESRTAGAVVRFGVVTDLHCADLDTADHTKFVPVAGKVYYRESLGKLEKAVAALNARAVDFVIELGDFKDLTKNRASTLPILDRAAAALCAFGGSDYRFAEYVERNDSSTINTGVKITANTTKVEFGVQDSLGGTGQTLATPVPGLYDRATGEFKQGAGTLVCGPLARDGMAVLVR